MNGCRECNPFVVASHIMAVNYNPEIKSPQLRHLMLGIQAPGKNSPNEKMRMKVNVVYLTKRSGRRFSIGALENYEEIWEDSMSLPSSK